MLEYFFNFKIISESSEKYILGISCFYHDSGDAFLNNVETVKALQEERFSRKKHNARFPINAIIYSLQAQNIDLSDIRSIFYYKKTLLTFDRLLETYLGIALPESFSFFAPMQIWLREKLFIKSELRKQFKSLQKELTPNTDCNKPEFLSSEHHQSNSPAFYPGPFKNALAPCMDRVGKWVATSTWIGRGTEIKPFWEINSPHSLGLLYSEFTYNFGLKVNTGEYKLNEYLINIFNYWKNKK